MIQLVASLALALAPAGDHAALHPAGANLYVDLPDLPGAVEAYAHAPLVRLVQDPEVHASLARVLGLPEEADPVALLRLELEGLLGARGQAALGELLALGSDLRAASVSVAGLEANEALLARADELDGNPAILLDHLGLVCVLEFGSVEAPATLLERLAGALSPVEPDEGAVATVELMGGDRQVHRFSMPNDLQGHTIWMVSADRLLIAGLGTAEPAELAARAGDGEALLTQEGFHSGVERFTTPAGATLYETYWRLSEPPFYAVLMERQQEDASPFARQMAAALLGGIVPLEPLIARSRLQLREGRFVEERLERRPAPADGGAEGAPAAAPWRRTLGSTPVPPAALGRVHPESVGVWATSLDRAGLADLVAHALDELPGGGEDLRASLEEDHGLSVDDLIASLGGDVALYMLPIGGAKVPQVHAVLGLSDAAAFEQSLTALARLVEEQAQGALTLDTRPYRKQPVVTLRPDPSALPLPPFLTLELSVGILEDRAIVGLSAMDVKGEMRRLLAGAPASHPAATEGRYPEGAVSVGWMDWGGLVGSLYETARTLLALVPDASSLPFDPARLPEAQVFTRFFRPTLSWTRPADGWTYAYQESSFGPEVQVALVAGSLVAAGRQATARSAPPEPPELPTPAEAPAPPADPGQATRDALQEVKLALVLYQSDRGAYPARLEELLQPTDAFPQGFLASEAALSDGWGHAIRYQRTAEGQGFRLHSPGPDGVDQRGEGDDVLAP